MVISCMIFKTEKRISGRDRRVNSGACPYSGRERRIADRRQIVVVEISFREWAAYRIHYQQRLVSRQQRRAERQARREEAKAAAAQGSRPLLTDPKK